MKLKWPKFRPVSFSSGRCPASKLAEYSIFVFLVQLIHCFEVKYEALTSHNFGIRRCIRKPFFSNQIEIHCKNRTFTSLSSSYKFLNILFQKNVGILMQSNIPWSG
ncbi:hypothetical protein DFH28DRAFT_981665 [Melampsora americana]|nr:hypothetical protein DFH28DRAFT_981665 [Melampsora americana]